MKLTTPHFAGEPPRSRLKDLCRSPVPTLEACALIVLTKALRHKLRVYDVVSGLVGLHHVEAAVAPAVERPPEQRLALLIYGKTSLHQDNIFFKF